MLNGVAPIPRTASYLSPYDRHAWDFPCFSEWFLLLIVNRWSTLRWLNNSQKRTAISKAKRPLQKINPRLRAISKFNAIFILRRTTGTDPVVFARNRTSSIGFCTVLLIGSKIQRHWIKIIRPCRSSGGIWRAVCFKIIFGGRLSHIRFNRILNLCLRVRTFHFLLIIFVFLLVTFSWISCT